MLPNYGKISDLKERESLYIPKTLFTAKFYSISHDRGSLYNNNDLNLFSGDQVPI